jgi:hypothetical protein
MKQTLDQRLLTCVLQDFGGELKRREKYCGIKMYR